MSTPVPVSTFPIRPWIFLIIHLAGQWQISNASAIVGNKIVLTGFETMLVLALRGDLH